MEIRINDRQAALKKGTSFEYVAENRLFFGGDGRTLSITFPLKDCPENIAIFGNINRKESVLARLSSTARYATEASTSSGRLPLQLHL